MEITPTSLEYIVDLKHIIYLLQVLLLSSNKPNAAG
jgi:hypothetical protein